MAHIKKPPEERKKELVDAAERLFLEKGYDNTTVDDIIDAINVSKGMFYHYFKSKSEILGPVIDKNIGLVEEAFGEIIDRDDIGTPEKINEIINSISRLYRDKQELMFFIHQHINSVPHYDLEELAHARLAPPIAELVARGVGEGRFNVCYPTQTAELILAAITHQLHRREFGSSRVLRERMRTSLEHFLAGVLRIDDYSFSLDSWQ